MTTQELFQVIQNSDFAIALGQANIIFGIFAQLFHIAGLVLLLTSILLVNLRLLGVGLTAFSARQLAIYTRPFFWLGFFFLVLSGLFMLVPSAALYEPNSAFWLKLKLLALALIIQVTLIPKVTGINKPNESDNLNQGKEVNRVLSVSSALVSLALWFSVGLAGRAIGFVAA